MTAHPAISVVVCTHERPQELARCLEALAGLPPQAEVLVVDSASRPPCAHLVRRFAGRVPGLRYLREDRPGLSRARNLGVAAARAPVVAFVDDDAAIEPGWCERMLAAFADPRVGCVGGACLPEFRAPRPRWLSDRLLQFAGITRFGEAARESRSSAEDPFGANLAFRREALAAAGGFSEALGRIGTSLLSGEESAVVGAVRAAGWRVWLEPGAAVRHAVEPGRTRARYYWRRLWWQGVGRARGPRAPWLTPRLLVAAPVRAALWPVTGDAVHLFRTAETAGYLCERLRRWRTGVGR